MALSNSLNNKYVMGGLVIEEHTWIEGAADTSGDLTLSTNSPLIGEVICAIPSNDIGANLVMATLTGNTVTLTYTAGDTGRVTVIGKAV